MAVEELKERVACFISTCQRRVLSVARRIRSPAERRSSGRRSSLHLSRRVCHVPSLAEGMKKFSSRNTSKKCLSKDLMKMEEQWEAEEAEGEEVWKKAILMGERCRPLEHSGVILYDCEGKRVEAQPRSPVGRQLPFSAE